MNKLIKWLVAQSRKDYSLLMRSLATLLGASLFVAGIPAVTFYVGKILDKGFLLPSGWAMALAFICFALGLPWVMASVLWQFIYGKGTPVPAFPTKEFLQDGPYKYIRNPMMLGFSLYLLGWSFLFNYYGAFVAASFFILLLFCEMKLIEERELEIRFGDAYREYKKDTPFLIPKWRKK